MGVHTCFILWCSLILAVKGTAPSLRSATYKVKDVVILGTQLTLAMIDMSFDQDLYLLDGFPCANINCTATKAKFNTGCPPCNYADPKCCGCAPQGCSCPYTQLYCNTTTAWAPLIEGVPTVGTAEGGSYTHYRVFIPDPCSAFKIKLGIRTGNPYLFISDHPPSKYNYTWSYLDLYSQVVKTLCPSDITPGTYFVAVYGGQKDQTQFVVHFSTHHFGDVSEVAAICPASGSSSHVCLHDGQPFAMLAPSASQQYFSFTIDSCKNISIGLHCYNGSDLDLYLSFNPNLTRPDSGLSDMASFHYGDDFLIFQKCPPPSQTLTMYITVDAFFGGAFSVSVNTQAGFFLRPLGGFNVYADIYDILGSVQVVAPEDTSKNRSAAVFYCRDWRFECQQFWHACSTLQDTPFYPRSPIFQNNYAFQYIGVNDGSPIVVRNATLTLAIPLAYTLTASSTVTSSLAQSDLPKTRIEFLGMITGANGEAITDYCSPVGATVVCDYLDFTTIKDSVDEVLQEMRQSTDTLVVTNFLYKIATLTFYDSWWACATSVTQLLDFTSSTVEANATVCAETPGTAEYDTDGCCYGQGSWNYCCRPHLVVANVSTPTSVAAAVESVCSNPVCATSYLQDYMTVLANLNGIEGCDQGIIQLDTKVNDYYDACKQRTFKAVCYEDQDCPTNYTCNRIDHVCRVPYDIEEQMFVQCLLDNIDPVMEAQIKKNLHLNAATKADPAYLAGFLNSTRIWDCIDPVHFNVNIRNHFLFEAKDAFCAAQSDCPSFPCEDTLCTKPEKNCFRYCSAEWGFFPSSSECEQEPHCNWVDCTGLSPSDCKAQCLAAPSHFCALCENGRDCTVFHQYTTQQECEQASMCVLADGTYTNSTQDASSGQRSRVMWHCSRDC